MNEFIMRGLFNVPRHTLGCARLYRDPDRVYPHLNPFQFEIQGVGSLEVAVATSFLLWL